LLEQNKDESAYSAGGYEPNKGAVGNMGEFFKQPGFALSIEHNGRKTSQIFSRAKCLPG
jgi:filamentous hemagglutinin